MIPPKFEYLAPTSLAEATAFLAAHPEEAKVVAGGQSLVPVLKLRLARPGYLVDLGRISGLSYIREEAGTIAIGALTTYAEIKESALLREKCPLLPQTAAVIADVQVRNRGTIGGSLSHADPSADMPAPILALGAELKAVGPKGERRIAVENFFHGMFATALAPDEILTEIRVPVLTGQRSAYLKAARRATDFALVGVAVRMRVGKNETCDEIAIGVTGVADKAYRPAAVERALAGKRLEPKAIEQAAAAAVQGVEPLGNIHGSAEYRANLARLYVARAIAAAK
ncbi:MAG: xanthine dehydrogenase family protein subunit M [Betaproteobacteria bacterium]|nr:xanthine dehydrogenase family protein subunit M [Betaproteobacteria bacterium]MBI2960810.1 xanthine dehydrogenase family protein subunit M [Betaproteobacteria bacterium]